MKRRRIYLTLAATSTLGWLVAGHAGAWFIAMFLAPIAGLAWRAYWRAAR